MSMTLREQGRRCSSQIVNQARFGGLFYVPQKPYSLLYRSTVKLPLSSLHRQAVVWMWLMKVLKWFGEQVANNLMAWAFGGIAGALFIYAAVVWDYTQIAWSWFTMPIQMSIGFVIISLILMVTCLAHSVTARRSVPQQPSWKTYREDEFAGAIWRWDYLGNNAIDDLRPYCKACDCALSLHFNYFSESIVYRCVSCNSEVNGFPRGTTLSDAMLTIQKLIDQRIRKQFSPKKAKAN